MRRPPSSTDHDVEAAVARAYEVFDRYGLDEGLVVCRCSVCVDAAAEQLLATTPLREIPWELLAQYTHSAHEWSPVVERQLRYFLPRYFELMAAGTDPAYYGACLDRLGNAAYRRHWPPSEADAIDEVFFALARRCLSSVPDVPDVDLGTDPIEDLLVTLARAGGDVHVILRAWEAVRDRAADLHMAAVVASANWTVPQLAASEWRDASRPAVRVHMEAVIAWLARPETRARLEAAWYAERDPAAAGLLSRAEALLAA